MKKSLSLPVGALLLSGFAFAQNAGQPAPQISPANPPVEPLKPSPVAETLKSFRLPEGYRMEAVLTEPDVREPVVAAFDANGRMFVAEMRTYMQDADGSNEHAPTSRISLHWSSKNDGNLDRHSVFIDGLLLPRMILPLGKGELLVNETDTQDIYLYKDADGDGVAEQKTLWYEGGPRGGNMEHQQSGLIWCMDNWLYATYNAWRLRWRPGGQPPLKEPTPGNGGQWGLTQDDLGKAWFVNAGGERGPINFQTHIVYGAFNLKNQFAEGYREVFPIVGLADVQGGERRFRPENGTLNHFTATCGAEVFRGDRLPKDLRGDLLFSEPVGRLVRRTKAEVRDGLTYLRNAYEKSEFILSSDPFFRVVNMNTAPDGTLYLVDMYRGIIQEGNWVRPGSYLRGVVDKYGLDKVNSHGRIWRLSHQDFQPGPQPSMYEDSSAKLVEHLSHPNGWWRDMAQRQLVLRQDTSVVPALKKAAESASRKLGRIHALWTLEGMDAADAALVRQLMKDAEPEVRAAALRVSETLFKAGDTSLDADYSVLLKDKDERVAMQALCTVNLLKTASAKELVQSCAMGKVGGPGLKEIATMMIAPPRTWGKEYSQTQVRLLEKGDAIFRELCFACHNLDGKGTPVDGRPGVTLAPPLAASRTVVGPKEGLVAVLLKGIAGPINGKTYESQMVAMETNNDEWIAAVGSYVRNSFGNKAGVVTTQEVAELRKSLSERKDPWTVDELKQFGPPTLANRSKWKLSASHNPEALAKAVDGNLESRYDTRVAQSPEMWVALELPAVTPVAGVRLDPGKSAGDYPRNFVVEISGDGAQWSQVADGQGKPGVLNIRFDARPVKALRIRQTGSATGTFWSIHELDLLVPESKPLVQR